MAIVWIALQALGDDDLQLVGELDVRTRFAQRLRLASQARDHHFLLRPSLEGNRPLSISNM